MELTEEQKALIEANREKAKRRRLERYLEQLENSEEKEDLPSSTSEPLGGGFIPDEEAEEDLTVFIQQSEILFPLEMNDRCCVCGSLELDDFILKNYKARVCPNCREAHQDRFSLMTKTSAKDEFLLTDEELRDSSRVPHVSKPNPHRPNWSDMQLFLKEQVRAFALDKWGSLEAIEAEAQKRADAHENLKEKKYMANLKELRQKTKLTKKPTTEKKTHNHRHTFEDSKNPTTGIIESKCTQCGFTIESEEL